MDISERIRHLRKDLLSLTQQEFSDALNISRSNLGNIEIGRISVTDRVISDICIKYSIDEEWLRNGTGDPFKKLDRKQEIAKLSADLFKSEDTSFKSRLIMALASMNEEEWEMLERIAKRIAEKKD